VVQNHQINGSQWILLGTFTMSPGSNHRLVLDGEGNGSLTAGAVAFVADDALPHLATWNPTITTSQEYDIYATWEAYAGRATDATYMIHHAGGTTHVVVDQTQEDSQWNYLGTFTMEPNEDHQIELRTDGNGSVIADAVLVAPAGSPVGTATWTPALSTTDQYAVYATWQAYAGRATDALYTIHHAGGSTNVAVDQTINGTQWNLLGTFTMAPSSNHRVVLSGLGVRSCKTTLQTCNFLPWLVPTALNIQALCIMSRRGGMRVRTSFLTMRIAPRFLRVMPRSVNGAIGGVMPIASCPIIITSSWKHRTPTYPTACANSMGSIPNGSIAVTGERGMSCKGGFRLS